MDYRSNIPSVPGRAGLEVFLWFIQVFLAAFYLWHGWLFISPPAELAEAMAGMRLSPAFQRFIGFAEVLASVALVLPGLTGILPWLTPLAALGLTIVTVSATVFHYARNEIPSAISSAHLSVLVTLTAYLRWRIAPLRGRGSR